MEHLGHITDRRRLPRSPRATQTTIDRHAEQARWLHDVVLSEIRLSVLRLVDGDSATTDAVAELQDLDHRLRTAHLAERVMVGGVSIGEVLQVEVRRLQSARIDIATPSDRNALDVPLDATTGMTVHECASVLTSNAINAGATVVSFDVATTPRHIDLSLTDDAGGFDLRAAPVGRALWRLSQHDSIAELRRIDAPSGSTVSARIVRDSAPFSLVSA